MANNFKIFGVEYIGVEGIIATDSGGNELTYTRGGGAPDRLTGPTDENKQVFDRFAPLFANKVMKTTIYSKLILVRFIQKRLTQKAYLTYMKKLMN